jgi:hypothetical protein
VLNGPTKSVTQSLDFAISLYLFDIYKILSLGMHAKNGVDNEGILQESPDAQRPPL